MLTTVFSFKEKLDAFGQDIGITIGQPARARLVIHPNDENIRICVLEDSFFFESLPPALHGLDPDSATYVILKVFTDIR